MSHFAGFCQFSGRWVMRGGLTMTRHLLKTLVLICDDVHRAILVLVPRILTLGIVAITWRCPPQWCSLKLFCVAYSQPLTKARTMSAHLPKSLLYFKVSHWRQLANQDVLYAPKSTSIPLLQRTKTIYYLKNPKFIQLSDSAFHMYAVHLVH